MSAIPSPTGRWSRRLLPALLVVLFMGHARLGVSAEPPARIDWQPWSDRAFERAKAENKLVLLDLGAGWCHWCHVMDEVTYRDAEVVRLLGQGYIALRVDQDSRPDLANRYEDYGWPATIVFKGDGTELAKRRGYLPPKMMSSMLQAFIDDPTPGPSVQPEAALIAASDSALTQPQRAEMRKVFVDAYDTRHGGWGDAHHYLNWNALELCLADGIGGDDGMRKMATQTLESGLKLIDPVWGGVYQYSTDGDWDHPHFEKIMPFQAENMRIFALASTMLKDPRWLNAANHIHTYLRNFLLSPEGAFYTSQDADVVRGEHSAEYFSLGDEARRKVGVPAVDRHLYARENGLAVVGLCALYAASGDEGCLADARRAAEWAIAQRARPEGGFRHDEKDAAGPYLADTLAMGRAFLALYTVTAERQWLRLAGQAAKDLDALFRGPIGYLTAVGEKGAPFQSMPQVDENVFCARFTRQLFEHTGRPEHRAMAEHAMRYLASPTVIKNQGFGTSGILLADRELSGETIHLTIVGGKDDPAAKALFAAGLRALSTASCIEWFDEKEGALGETPTPFPKLKVPAAYLCAHGSCSAPIKSVDGLLAKLAAERREK